MDRTGYKRDLVRAVTDDRNSECLGRAAAAADNDIATETQGGARINYIFHKMFFNIIGSIDPFDNLTEQDIQTAIKNSQAMGVSLFVPEGAFEVLIKQ